MLGMVQRTPNTTINMIADRDNLRDEAILLLVTNLSPSSLVYLRSVLFVVPRYVKRCGYAVLRRAFRSVGHNKEKQRGSPNMRQKGYATTETVETSFVRSSLRSLARRSTVPISSIKSLL